MKLLGEKINLLVHGVEGPRGVYAEGITALVKVSHHLSDLCLLHKKQNLIWYFMGIEFNIDNIILFVIFYLSIPA